MLMIIKHWILAIIFWISLNLSSIIWYHLHLVVSGRLLVVIWHFFPVLLQIFQVVCQRLRYLQICSKLLYLPNLYSLIRVHRNLSILKAIKILFLTHIPMTSVTLLTAIDNFTTTDNNSDNAYDICQPHCSYLTYLLWAQKWVI